MDIEKNICDSDGAGDTKNKNETGNTAIVCTNTSPENLEVMEPAIPFNDNDETEISSVKDITKHIETESTLQTKLNGKTKENSHSLEDETSDSTSEKIDDVGQDDTLAAENKEGEENKIKKLNEKVGVKKDSNETGENIC